MKLPWSALVAFVALFLMAPLASSSAVSFVSIRKNDGIHGQSSTSYGVQHGGPGQDAAHVELLQTNGLGVSHSGLRQPQVPVVPVHPAPVAALAAGGHLGLNGVVGGPLALAARNGAGYAGSLAGAVNLGGPGGPGGLVGSGGPVGARLVQPGGPLDGPYGSGYPAVDGHGAGPRLVRLRDDPANRVGINGQAPVKDSFPRPALRTVEGIPIWVPSYTNDPPSYEK